MEVKNSDEEGEEGNWEQVGGEVPFSPLLLCAVKPNSKDWTSKVRDERL